MANCQRDSVTRSMGGLPPNGVETKLLRSVVLLNVVLFTKYVLRSTPPSSSSGILDPVNTLGELERGVMEQLWRGSGTQSVREVHAAIGRDRDLAYTTVMT